MAVFFEDKGKVKHINVISFEGKDIEYLTYLLEKECIACHEVYIYDTDILPAKAVEKLACHVENKKIKVIAQRRILRDYLSRLGVSSILLKRNIKDIVKINTQIAETLEWEAVLPVLECIYEQYGYDFRSYQRDSIIRRISNYVFSEKDMTLKEWMQNLIENRESIGELLSGLTVNTTEFFRDGKVYEAVRNTILPQLNTYPSIKIWCAGCSTGEEAYSIAILLDEAGLLDKSLVYATDLSFSSIRQAQNGLYSKEAIKKGMKNYQESGGTGILDNCFLLHNTCLEIKERYKEHVLFFQHSLVESGVINEFQLIICRNVLIYFNHELQARTLSLFHESMDRSAFLVLGKSEGNHSLTGTAGFTEIDSKNKIYKKTIINQSINRGSKNERRSKVQDFNRR